LSRRFQGRDKTLESLALQFCSEGKWEEAEMILKWEFQGSDSVMELLGTAYCRIGKWEKAENIVRFQFEGRDNVLQLLAAGYCRSNRCEEAGRIVVRELLRKGKSINAETADTIHSLALQYLAKRDFMRAEHYCLAAISWKQMLLGDSDLLYFHSTSLLARIYEVQGKRFQADERKAQLPDG
jgi:hypothetical protein